MKVCSERKKLKTKEMCKHSKKPDAERSRDEKKSANKSKGLMRKFNKMLIEVVYMKSTQWCGLDPLSKKKCASNGDSLSK